MGVVGRGRTMVVEGIGKGKIARQGYLDRKDLGEVL